MFVRLIYLRSVRFGATLVTPYRHFVPSLISDPNSTVTEQCAWLSDEPSIVVTFFVPGFGSIQEGLRGCPSPLLYGLIERESIHCVAGISEVSGSPPNCFRPSEAEETHVLEAACFRFVHLFWSCAFPRNRPHYRLGQKIGSSKPYSIAGVAAVAC